MDPHWETMFNVKIMKTHLERLVPEVVRIMYIFMRTQIVTVIQPALRLVIGHHKETTNQIKVRPAVCCRSL